MCAPDVRLLALFLLAVLRPRAFERAPRFLPFFPLVLFFAILQVYHWLARRNNGLGSASLTPLESSTIPPRLGGAGCPILRGFCEGWEA
jgi:hypothetical protein